MGGKKAVYKAQVEGYRASGLGGRLKNKRQDQRMLHHNS